MHLKPGLITGTRSQGSLVGLGSPLLWDPGLSNTTGENSLLSSPHCSMGHNKNQNWVACLLLPPALPQRPPQTRPCRVNEGNAAGPVLNRRQCPERLLLSAGHSMFPMTALCRFFESWSPCTPGTQNGLLVPAVMEL